MTPDVTKDGSGLKQNYDSVWTTSYEIVLTVFISQLTSVFLQQNWVRTGSAL